MGFFTSRTTQTQNPFETNPWGPQQHSLTHGFQQGRLALAAAMREDNTPKDLVADLNQGQMGSLNNLSNNGNGPAQRIGGTMAGQGVRGLASSTDFQNNANDAVSMAMRNMPNGSFDAYRDNATGMFNPSGVDPRYLDTYGQNAQSTFDMATQNATGQIINDATQYANNPFLEQQIDGALGDIRTAFDRNVGDINSAAVGSGNINSTRAGALEAIAADDAMDRAGQISSSMRGDAFNTGLAMSQAENARRVSDGITANQQFGSAFDRVAGQDNQEFSQRLASNSQLGDAAQLEQQFGQQQLSGVLSANQQVGQAADRGAALAQSGYGMSQQGYSDALTAADRFQAQQQAEITAQTERAMYERQLPMDLVEQYMRTIGGSYGNRGFQTTTSKSASPFQQIVGGAASLLGGYGAIR